MRILLALLLALIYCNPGYTQTKVILDADIDSDVDDAAALAMLHNLSANNEIQLMGVIVTSDDPFSPLCVDAINAYFGRSDLPVGFEKQQASLKNHSRYTRQVSESFPHRLNSYKDATEAVILYRMLLSKAADNSVVIVTIGHLTSFQHLLQSGADGHSSLNGKSLALKKIKKWICMGGMFPEGKEANFYRPDPASTKYCLQEWTKPVVFCGWEAGKEVISGGQELKAILSAESPVYKAFELYNNFAGRPSWDQLAVLLLTKRSRQYFDIIKNGYCSVEPDGSNRWISGKKSSHAYIRLKAGADRLEIAKYINQQLAK